MNIEEAREIAKGFVIKPGKDMLLKDLQLHFHSKGFIEGYESGRREALESEAVKELVEALEYCQRHGLYGGAKEALSRFEQFKQEGRS